MKVITISGKAQNGKDTMASLLKKSLEESGYRVLIAHYADLVKYVCKQFFGWDGEKDERGRSLLQYVGTDVVRNKEPDYWVNFLVSILKMFPDDWDYVLIPDCRFPNEVDRMKEAGFDTIHIRVKREGFQSPLTAEQQAHLSETALDDSVPDLWLINTGTINDLQNKIDNWLKSAGVKEVA